MYWLLGCESLRIVEEEEGAGRCFQIRGDYSTVETELLGIHRQNFGILNVALGEDRRGYFGWNHGKRFRRPSIL